MNTTPSGYFELIDVPLAEIKAAIQTFQNDVDATITGVTGGGGGPVTSFNGRVGAVSPATDDYTWAQINKTTSSLADITTRSASDLSSGTLPAGRMPALTGDISTSAGSVSTTLATVNSNVGTFGSATQSTQFTVNAKGLITAAANVTITPAVGSITGLGTGVATFLATPSSANLIAAITDETGSGALVFATSPTLVTPTIAKLANLTSNGFVKTSGGDGTLSVDTTSYTPTSRTLTAGAGLTGGGDLSADRTFTVGAGAGITINADDVALTTPGTLTVASSNSSSGSHTHAITSSSNPGAAAAILATDASGYLTTVRHTVTDYLFVNNATANLYLKNTSTGFQSATTLIITPQSGNSIQSTSYTSGLSGFSINAVGDAEFNNVTTRGELRASVFKVNEIAATAGTFGVFYSASTLNSDATTPSIASSFTFDAKNSDSGGMLFGGGEVVRFKAFVSPSGTIIGDAWATITGRTNHTTYATYTATMNSGSTATVFRAGTAIADYGVSGAGFITLSADGTVGSSPNLTMGTHAGSPWSSQTTLLRLGNLNGSYGYATDIYGFAAGDNSASWIKIDPTNGIRLGNAGTTKVSIDASGNASFAGSITASGGTIGGLIIASNKIYSGTGTFNNTNTAFYLDVDGAFSLKDKLAWNGTTLTINGAITSTSGTIGGFTIGATSLLAGSGSTTVAMDSGGTNPAFYAGSATPGSAPFRVTNAGALIATDATITGAITATSGSITGTLTMSGSGSAIAIGATPPTSASAGTGIWLDRTGMYGLLSNVVQAKFDAATGKISAGAGAVTLGAAGINIGGVGLITISTNIGTTSSDGLVMEYGGASGVNLYSTRIRMDALGSTAGADTIFSFITEARGLNKNPGGGALVWAAKEGAGSYIDLLTLFSNGNLTVTGLLKTGSGPTTLTDSAGKILSAALNTVAVANGGTGATSASITAFNNITGYSASGATGTTSTNLVFSTSPTVTSLTNNGELNVAGSGSAARLLNLSGTGTGFMYAKMANTGGELWMGLEGSGGGDLIGSTAGYGAIFGTIGSKKLYLVTNSAIRMMFDTDGSVVVGSPTGGSKGAGTINAVGVYDDNVLLSDALWDLYYDGKVRDADKAQWGDAKLLSIAETDNFTRTNRHLPGLPGRDEWAKSSRSLGEMVTGFWGIIERQQMQIFELNKRIAMLEARH